MGNYLGKSCPFRCTPLIIFHILIMYSNADWNDRFSSFIKNRIVWQSVAEIIVYHYALQNVQLGYFVMYRFMMEFSTIFECPMFLMSLTETENDESGILYFICLIGFMLALPIKVLLILFFWWKFLFSIFGSSYTVVAIMPRIFLLVWSLLTDAFAILKILMT